MLPNAEESEEHEATASQMIHQMYLHRENILLVLTKSQRTKYENIADRFIDSAEKHYRLMADGMEIRKSSAGSYDEYLKWRCLCGEQLENRIKD